MFDTETLLNLGLPNHVVSIWQVFIYLGFMVPLLLLQRAKLCLLITYLFTYYLAFLIYWADVIVASGSMIPFYLYGLTGVAILVLFVLGSLLHEARMKQGQRG